MKSYTITVNGIAYDVTVEEKGPGSAPAPVHAAAPAPKAPAAAPKAAPKPAAPAGSVSIIAPMPGKILAIKANPGQAVKRGEPVLILEAMKMENEIVAPEDGTVASLQVAVGDSVESGDVLATLN